MMIKVLSLFSGIGAFEKALNRIGIDYELVNYCEIDKHASKSYSQIHNVSEDLNLWDVTTIDTSKLPKNIDLLTHGSPCQSYSIAGKQEGGDKGSGTQSSLMWETVRIVGDIKPKIIIWENVKNVLSKKHKHNFDAYIESLNELNYNSYYKVLNAKNFGIPQNRERVFVVSIRKDIDDGNFKFPEGFPLKLRIKDLLDEVVDSKFYLGQKSVDRLKILMASNKSNNQNDSKEPSIQRIDIPQTVKVRKYPIDCKSLCECLRKHKTILNLTNKGIAEEMGVPLTMVEHWFRQDIYFAIPEAELWSELKALLGITTDEFDDAIMTFEERDGVYEKSERHYFADGIMPTLTSTTAGKEKIITIGTIIDDTQGFDGVRYYNEYAPSLRASRSGLKTMDAELNIRNLTPKECFRLMNFDDEDFEKAAKVSSQTQLYKQAGNSICVNVPEVIFNKLRVYFEKEIN